MTEKATVVRCQHKWNGKKCNIPLCLRTKDSLIIKRHGREIHLDLCALNHVKIICERCQNTTFIESEKKF